MLTQTILNLSYDHLPDHLENTPGSDWDEGLFAMGTVDVFDYTSKHIVVVQPNDPTLPDWIKPAHELACELQCKYIVFSADGAHYNKLPIFQHVDGQHPFPEQLETSTDRPWKWVGEDRKFHWTPTKGEQ